MCRLHKRHQNKGTEGTIVTVSPLYKLKFGLIGELVDRLYVRPTYRQGMEALLAGLKRYVEAGAAV